MAKFYVATLALIGALSASAFTPSSTAITKQFGVTNQYSFAIRAEEGKDATESVFVPDAPEPSAEGNDVALDAVEQLGRGAAKVCKKS